MSAIGEFRERITIQAEQRTPDTGGGAVLAWVDVADAWAAVEPLRGKTSTLENIQADAVTGVGYYRLTMRAGVDVTAAMRIVWRARLLNIRSVRMIDARDRVMEILAEEGVAI